ncbi:protein trapped in endoderm-1-like [Antedon mediterranea]|uniref:protein trapped in endoderm-1-like n=1 Tax=Antedon mediterranea TaxID=105859 RepID=UPI003AF5755C
MDESHCNVSYINVWPAATIIECVYITVLSILGIFGNVFVITVILCSKSLHNPHYFYVCCLSGFDLFTTSVLMPMFIVTLQVEIPAMLCTIFAYLRLWTVGMVLCMLSSMSINRFMKVSLHKETYTRYTTKRWITLNMFWAGSLTGSLILAPLWGFGEAGFNVALHHCTFTYNYEGWCLAILLESVGISITITCLSITNYVIYKTVRNSKRRVQNVSSIHIKQQPPSNASLASSFNASTRHKRKDDNKITYILLAMISTFMVCWLPFSIAMLFNKNCTIPVHLLQFMDILLWTNSAIDPFIYAWLNSQFLKAAKRVVPCLDR